MQRIEAGDAARRVATLQSRGGERLPVDTVVVAFLLLIMTVVVFVALDLEWKRARATFPSRTLGHPGMSFRD